MLTRILGKYNISTLSGAVDIIIVEHTDGSLRSSPWFVRFGKLGLIHHSDKVITVSINDEIAPFYMYVDVYGRGQFFSSQMSTSKNSKADITYPNKTLPSFDLTPHDIRQILSEKKDKQKENVKNENFSELLIRDSAVDLTAAFEFEDNDPHPLTTQTATVDLIQDIESTQIDSEIESSETPVPSSLLLHQIRPFLKKGANHVTFTVSSLIQGPKTVHCVLFLWDLNVKLCITDVDGTVTKSDLMGHILPTIGGDWTKPGVAKLFNIMEEKGLTFLYLSSRPVGEATLTRHTIEMIEQDGLKLPDGPVISSPDLMISSLTREVVLRKPHTFKIPILATISALFGDINPYYFGLGNRKYDVLSYVENGVPDSRILLFDTRHRVYDSKMNRLYKSIPELSPHIEEILKAPGVIQ